MLRELSVALLWAALVPPPAQAEDDCGSMLESVTRFRGVVTAVEPLGRRNTVVTPVDPVPLYAASVRVLDVEDGDGKLHVGEIRDFAIHSPSRTFVTDRVVGVELDLELHSLACDGSFRRFFDLSERTPSSVGEFQGTLEVGKSYRTAVRWDRDLGLLPRDRLTGPWHHGLGIDWKNLADFPELTPGGGVASISFEVVERRTHLRGEREWVTIYGCRIIEVRGPR